MADGQTIGKLCLPLPPVSMVNAFSEEAGIQYRRGFPGSLPPQG
jgi:hypothetical protein